MSGLRVDRPGLDALRTCIGTGRVQIVLATEPARIARDWTIIDDLERACHDDGVRLAYVETQPDLRSIMERLFAEERRRRARMGCPVEDEDLP